MRHYKIIRSIGVVVALLALLLVHTPAALAAAPRNDNFSRATVISALPFSAIVNNTSATTELNEPQACGPVPRTVWYSFTPASSGTVRADVNGSSVSDVDLAVYQAIGTGFSGLNFLGCASFGGAFAFNVQAGTTYYLQASDSFSGGGDLHVNLQAVAPPANDNFANATAIGAVPFSDSLDTASATLETAEPNPCFGPLTGSVWYAFKPTVSGSYAAMANASFASGVTVYVGSALGNIAELECGSFGQLVVFHADANVTYYIQVVNIFGSGGQLQFNLDVAPPPVAGFGFFPSDPSSFDNTQFFDASSDPAGVGVGLQAWDFGDGTKSTDFNPTHRFAADGDYTVAHAITTIDGRTASTSQVVQVRTHDVAITSLAVPTSARAGQTRQISVNVNSKRFPETVEVQLFKSTPGGFDLVGTLTQSVPVRSANRTTGFSFSYTFTAADASVGKVTFRATAVVISARDALPADNEAIAPPTKVSR